MAAKQPAKRKSVKGEAKSPKKNSSGKVRAKSRKQPKKHRWLRILIGAIVAIVIIVAAAFSWDRWLRFDDATDIQGSWQAAGQAAVVEIDGQQLHLTDEVSYDYTLDTFGKTIKFSFGKLSGEGTYRFSADRQTLTIVEGGTVNIFREFFLMFGLDIGEGDDAGKPTTVFTKYSEALPAAPQESGEDQASEADPVQEPDVAAEGDQAQGVSEDGSGGDGESEPSPDDSSAAGTDRQSVGGTLFDTINDRGVSS